MTFGPITVISPGTSALVGVVGPIGKTGTPGTNGLPGPQGPAVFTPLAAWVSGLTYSAGTATSPASYVSINGGSYACTTVHTSGIFATDLAAGLWQAVALQGATGNPGIPGSTWYTGAGAPVPAIGINNDYFFRTDTCDILLKVSGAWNLIGNIRGAAGNTINTGLGPPAAATGVNGDSYIDVTSGAPVFWGPKANGAWPSSGTSLVGPTGPGNGSVNPSGSTTQGDFAVFGSSGTVIQDSGLSAAVPAALPTTDGTAAVGSAKTLSRSDHVHPSDTSRLAIANALSEIAAAGLQGAAAQSLAVLQIASALAEIAAQGHLSRAAARNNIGALSKGRILALAIAN